jgi:hypothetical protein
MSRVFLCAVAIDSRHIDESYIMMFDIVKQMMMCGGDNEFHSRTYHNATVTETPSTILPQTP